MPAHPSTQSLPVVEVESPIIAATWPSKTTPRVGRRILLFVFLVVVAVGAGIGTHAMLVAHDETATAEGGYLYSTDAYTVLFPGEPRVVSQDAPHTGSAFSMRWENKLKVYVVSYSPAVPRTATLDDALAGALAASGGTLVESEEIEIDGGDAVLARSEADGETYWSMIVLSDARDLFVLSHNGHAEDEAFFESFEIG